MDRFNMPKPAKPARAKRQAPEFHEALSLPITPAAALPHVSEHLGETAAGLKDALRDAHRRLASRSIWQGAPQAARRILRATIRATRASIHHLPATTAAASRQLWHALLTGVSTLTRVWASMGLATTNFGLRGINRLWVSAIMARQTTWQYLPAITRDIRSALAYTWRLARSKPAKIGALSLAVISAIAVSAALIMLAGNTFKAYATDLSSQAMLMAKKKTGTTIVDKNGTVLFEGYGAQAAATVKLTELPMDLRQATLAAEDPEFYAHPGFSWQGTLRAAWVDVTHGSTREGGSTLTQQLVKNTLLTQDKNFIRKFKELLLSTRIEQQYSKDQILEMYLNGIYYGQGAYGVEAAAKTYFHKSAKDLTLAESALIAGLPLGPSRFDPNFDLEAATGRRDFVLNRMAALGQITKAQADAARSVGLVLENNSAEAPAGSITVYARQVKILAPHFVFYVLNQLRQTYGDEMVEQGGITVRTTLDYALQLKAQETVTNRINELSDHHVTNGGLVSVEPGSGDIIAMVGSTDYNAPGFGNVNVTLSELQPGSSFKPFAYITAFKKGWNGATKVDDVPLYLPNADGTVYAPKNYDLQWHGTVTLRRALDNSLNIPAVKVLLFAGIHDTIQTAHDLGITSLQDESRFGPALVLGGGEVKPIDMATAYATLANNGTYVPTRAILNVTDRIGRDITKPSTATPKNVLDPKYAFMITHIMADNNSRVPEFPINSPLKLSRPAAAKTGTTNDFRDNWTVGYTPQLATAVWVGNNDHSAMEGVTGITGAAPIWHDFMEAAHTGVPVKDFTAPEGVTIASICPNGALADGFTTGLTEVFLSDALPTERCGRIVPETPSPTPGASDNAGPDTTNLPSAARKLLERIARQAGGIQ